MIWDVEDEWDGVEGYKLIALDEGFYVSTLLSTLDFLILDLEPFLMFLNLLP